MTIIIVDDHGDWRDTIAEYIQELGLGEAILTAGSLSELDQLLLAVTPGILVLDAMLPDGDGLSRVSHLRTTYPAMGIIMLTGRLLSEDKVSGLSLGADHYLTKPVNLAELGATLVSLSRRLRVVPSPDPARAEGVWRFDPARRQLLSPTRVNVDITDTESRLLGALIQAAPLPLTRGRLVEALGASAEAYDTHRLDAHMHRLRRSCARWPAATWAYARSTASATSAPRPCRSWAASRPRPESATPATPRCIPPRPPRRSALYMPGANARALDKARGLDADVLILDLEDAVAPDAKPQARAQVAAALQAGGYGRRECVARINALDTPWGLDDARALAAAGADAVLLPKVESPAQLDAGAGIDAPARPPTFPCGPCAKRRWAFCVWTPSPAIPGWRPWSWHVGPGQDLHARHTPGREETLLARSLAIMAARAHGLAALDGVHLDLDDDAGLALACEQGRNQASTARR